MLLMTDLGAGRKAESLGMVELPNEFRLHFAILKRYAPS